MGLWHEALALSRLIPVPGIYASLEYDLLYRPGVTEVVAWTSLGTYNNRTSPYTGPPFLTMFCEYIITMVLFEYGEMVRFCTC